MNFLLLILYQGITEDSLYCRNIIHLTFTILIKKRKTVGMYKESSRALFRVTVKEAFSGKLFAMSLEDHTLLWEGSMKSGMG
jgi:hypothetical protein